MPRPTDGIVFFASTRNGRVRHILKRMDSGVGNERVVARCDEKYFVEHIILGWHSDKPTCRTCRTR